MGGEYDSLIRMFAASLLDVCGLACLTGSTTPEEQTIGVVGASITAAHKTIKTHLIRGMCAGVGIFFVSKKYFCREIFVDDDEESFVPCFAC